jgi:hypothetical protein
MTREALAEKVELAMCRWLKALIARVPVALLRTWLAFSVTAFVAALVFSLLDGDNLLRSDDPYLAGGFAAVFCAGFSLLFGVTGAFGRSSLKQWLA